MTRQRRLTRKDRQELGAVRTVNPKFEHERVAVPPVRPKTEFQNEVLNALRTKQVIVILGSAGIGKTFLSMTHAADNFIKGKINKISLSRPAVGMGNTLGLLKGGMREKYEPYLLPLVEEFIKRYGKAKYETALSAGNIELVALEYLRGRNLEGVAIVDEAQNTTPNEMYSILTRLTGDGQLILLGDLTQNDINGTNGLEWLEKFIRENKLEDVATIIYGSSEDIVRGEFCKRVVQAREAELAFSEVDKYRR